MRKAVQVDDEQFFKVQEKLAQLEVRTESAAEDKSSFEGLWTFSGFSMFVSRTFNTKNLGMGSGNVEHDCLFSSP